MRAILSDVVPAAVALLPDALRANLRVAHQARDEDAERAAAGYEAAGVRAEIAPFFADIPRRLSEAQLVISRSGASSVADISVIGRPAILVPYAAATGDHQTANARGLVEAGAAVVMQEKALDAETLSAPHRRDPARPTRGRDNGANPRWATGKPDATARLVALVEDLAGEHAMNAAAPSFRWNWDRSISSGSAASACLASPRC